MPNLSPESLPISFFVVAIVAIGMAASFFAADPGSPSSRALALTLGLIGTTMLLNVPLEAGIVSSHHVVWIYAFSLLEAAIIVSSLEWVRRIAQTRTLADSRSATAPLLRVGQAVAAVYGLMGMVLPQARLTVWQEGAFRQPISYVFAVPFFLSLALALVQLSRSEIEPAERLRLRALAAAAPFLAAASLVPLSWKPARSQLGKRCFSSARFAITFCKGAAGNSSRGFFRPSLPA